MEKLKGFVLVFCFSEIRSYSVAQAGLKFALFLTQPWMLKLQAYDAWLPWWHRRVHWSARVSFILGSGSLCFVGLCVSIMEKELVRERAYFS